MPERLQRYPAYRDSGLEWLGEVPEHWDLRRTKTLLRQRNEKGYPDEPLLAATQTKGVVRKEKYENRTVLAMKDLHLLKLVRIGDFVISLRSFQGGIEYARERGIISPAYTVLFPARAENHAYIAHLFKSAPYVENLALFVTGIRQGQNIDYAKLARSRLPLPPLPEQRAIVRFLDHADRRIRRYIRAKERLIELLEEQKQASIHQAVTGQIDVRTGQPYPAYKDSGMEWLGEVPEHWQLVPNKAVLSRRKVLVGENHTQFTLLSLTKKGVIVRDLSTGRGKFSVDMGTSQEVRVGDLVFCLFDVAETPRTVGLSHHDGMITGAYTVFECSDHLLRRFLEAFYIAMDDRKLLEPLYSGLRNTIPPPVFLSVKTPIPPTSEREVILEHLDTVRKSIRAAMEHSRREIRLLHEYRTRLIADVVTGKLDVREAAASLPETDPLTVDDPTDHPAPQVTTQGDIPNSPHPHP